jgi:hypothetical protein
LSSLMMLLLLVVLILGYDTLSYWRKPQSEMYTFLC